MLRFFTAMRLAMNPNLNFEIAPYDLFGKLEFGLLGIV
jgi:hypothetical protein